MTGDDLMRFQLLQELEGDERDAVCEVLERRELDGGATLFCEGDPADGMVLVETGSLRLCSRRAGDLGVVSSGAVLGASSLAGPGKREATAEATAETRVYVLTRESYRYLSRSDPRAANKVLEAAFRDLADAVRADLDRITAARA